MQSCDDTPRGWQEHIIMELQLAKNEQQQLRH